MLKRDILSGEKGEIKMTFFARFKNKKGITGTDVAAAITLIVLTVGIVTSIYINTLKKSKDTIRYANAVRIATNIMENIEQKPYEYVTTMCYNEETHMTTREISGGEGVKFLGTKIPNGYSVTITAKRAGSLRYDVARDIIISVKYKANSTYKTITLTGVKEKELMDMTNAPDISLMPSYNPNEKDTYYYPIKKYEENYMITTTTDIDWYDYQAGEYALLYKTTNGNLNVGTTYALSNIKNNVYVWIPRFVAKTEGGTGLDAVQFLYGSSNYLITLNLYGSLWSYGVKYPTDVPITDNSEPYVFDYNHYSYQSFQVDDGLSAVWYPYTSTSENVNRISARLLNQKIPAVNIDLPT